MTSPNLLGILTTEEKAELCNGKDVWHLNGESTTATFRKIVKGFILNIK